MDSGVSDKILPDGRVEMIFHFGGRYTRNKETDNELLGRFFVNGQNTHSFTLSPTGKSEVLGVRFLPFGAWPFLHIPMIELTGRFVSLEELYGVGAKVLTESMFNANSWQQRIQIVEEFLINELDHSRWSVDPVVNQLVHRIYRDRSRVNLGQFATDTRYSERHIRRKFTDIIGINPSIFTRIVRFREVFAMKKNHSETELLSLALDSGYHDQSHFIRDFKEFTGETPNRFFGRQHALGGNFF